MKISPKYTIEDWRKIDFGTEAGWQKAVDIFEDRIKGRFLEPISLMINYKFAGFAIMALDCLLIETLQQFYKGDAETPQRKSKEYFIKFLSSDSSFKNFLMKRQNCFMSKFDVVSFIKPKRKEPRSSIFVQAR